MTGAWVRASEEAGQAVGQLELQGPSQGCGYLGLRCPRKEGTETRTDVVV